jgi:hypothetical protein
MLEAYIKQVREFAYGEAEHGRCPPGWKLVQKRATRRWRDEHSALQLLSEKFKLSAPELCEEPKLKSPAQVEKLLAKGARGALTDLVSAESSGFTLAPESDPREPAKTDAKSEFGVIDVTAESAELNAKSESSEILLFS